MNFTMEQGPDVKMMTIPVSKLFNFATHVQKLCDELHIAIESGFVTLDSSAAEIFSVVKSEVNNIIGEDCDDAT